MDQKTSNSFKPFALLCVLVFALMQLGLGVFLLNASAESVNTNAPQMAQGADHIKLADNEYTAIRD